MNTFMEYYKECLKLIELALVSASSKERLKNSFKASESMRYSLLSGGKRVRPVLTLAVAKAFNLEYTPELIEMAVSIEMIHNYSLIHDDLPSMDNDSLRRGKPTNHMVFGEGMAILGGDALLNLAYERLFKLILKNPKLAKPAYVIAREAGINGMVGGQSMDLEVTGYKFSDESIEHNLEYLVQLQDLKTGGLIRASVLSAYYYAEIYKSELINSSILEELFTEYANKLGLAFQIRDDLLDVLSDEQTLGKTIGKDSRDNKLTFVNLLGIEKTQECETILQEEIKSILKTLHSNGLNIGFLEEFTDFLLNREY